MAMWSASINLLAGDGLVDFSGEPLTLWPPLFSFVLAAAAWVGLDPLEAGRWLNAAAFAGTILLAGLWLAKLVRSRAVAAGGALAVAVSYPLNVYAAYLLTEPLTILFILAGLVHLDGFLHRRRGMSALLWAGAFAALATVTRYPGVALVLAGTGALLWNRSAPLARRMRHAAVFGAVSSAPLAVVLARNWAATGTATGHRDVFAAGHGLLDSLVSTAKSLATWAVPGAGPEWFPHLPWIAAAALPLAAAVALVAFPGALRRGTSAAAPAVDPAARTCLLFAAVYLVFLFATTARNAGQPIDSRYLLLLFVPVVVAGALLADRFLRFPAPGRSAVAKRAAATVALAGCLVHFGFAVRKNVGVTKEWMDRGDATWAALNSAYWDGSETLRRVGGERLDSVVYSNAAALLWHRDATAPPGTYRHLPLKTPQLARGLDPGGAVVWFDGLLYRLTEYGAEELSAMPGVEVLTTWPDGKLLRAGSAEGGL